MPAINNPPSIHQAKKRRKVRKGVSFWLETEEGKGRPLQKQNTQMWPISRGGKQRTEETTLEQHDSRNARRDCRPQKSSTRKMSGSSNPHFFIPPMFPTQKQIKAQQKDRLTESQEIQNKKESQEHAMAHRRGTRNGALRNDAVTCSAFHARAH